MKITLSQPQIDFLKYCGANVYHEGGVSKYQLTGTYTSTKDPFVFEFNPTEDMRYNIMKSELDAYHEAHIKNSKIYNQLSEEYIRLKDNYTIWQKIKNYFNLNYKY